MLLTNFEKALKYFWCIQTHQDNWTRIKACMTPPVDLAVCNTCGLRHITNKCVVLESDVNRMYGKFRKMKK